MLDIKRIRQNPKELEEALKARKVQFSTEELLVFDEKRRELLALTEEKKTLRNAVSKKIGMAKKNGARAEELLGLTQELRTLSDEINQSDAGVAQLDSALDAMLQTLPNYPHESVPVCDHAAEYAEIRNWGHPRHFQWEPKTADEICYDLHLVKQHPTEKLFVFWGAGAFLARKLADFFLSCFSEEGYTETGVPFSFGSTRKDSSILSDLFANTVLECDELPVRLCSYSCLSRCEDSLAADTLPMVSCSIVEQNKLVEPERSYPEFESMLLSAENALQRLGLPYRVTLCCANSMEFAAAKEYHLEVWMPSLDRYLPCARFSNYEDFWARRSATRYRNRALREKPQLVHTLRGRIFIERLLTSVAENFQNEDGSISVPPALISYMHMSQIK